MTLFAVVGGALLQLFQEGLNQTERSSKLTHAALLAHSKLTELQAFDSLEPGEESGDFGGGYRWHLTLTEDPQFEDPGIAPLTPLRLSLHTFWGNDSDARSVTVDTLILSHPRPR